MFFCTDITMLYDDLLKRIGEFGKYQRLQYFLICLVSITSSLHSMNMVFVGPVPRHHCQPTTTQEPSTWSNLTNGQRADLLYPIDLDTADEHNQCSIYNMTEVDWDEGDYDTWIKLNRTVIDKCPDGWWYSTEYYDSTIVSEVINSK